MRKGKGLGFGLGLGRLTLFPFFLFLFFPLQPVGIHEAAQRCRIQCTFLERLVFLPLLLPLAVGPSCCLSMLVGSA